MAEQTVQFGPGQEDLRLEESECLVLSPGSTRFRSYYQQVRPRSIEEVRAILGLSKEAATALHQQACCKPSAVSSALVPADDLTADDNAVRARARSFAYAAASEYVAAADPARLAPWKSVLDRFLEVTKSLINVVALRDIDVANGATLTISANTHALYANNVRIHGSGKIVCLGKLTFKISSLEGLHRHIITTGISSVPVLTRSS